MARQIVSWASKKYNNNNMRVFLPTTEVYGQKDVSDSYINSKRLFLEHINEIDTQKLQPNIVFPDSFVDGKIPSKYYNFDPSKSIIFQFDGNETDTYLDRIYIK